MLTLLNHQRKERQRSPFWQKNLIINIILGLLGLYLLMILLVVGFSAELLIKEIYGQDADPTLAFTRLLFYFFSYDLIIRFLAQQLPTLSIRPYLTLPVSKNRLIHYPLVRSISSFFNIIPVILFLPFFIKVIFAANPLPFSLTMSITVLSLIGMNNFLNFSLKKYFSRQPLLILLMLAVTGLALFLDIREIISVSEYFSLMVIYIAGNPYLFIFPVMIVILTYTLAYSLLKNNSYIEDVQDNRRKLTGNFSFLSRYGSTGDLLALEIKMMLRNKRTKSILFFSLFLLAYGFILYDERGLDSYLTLIIAGFILTAACSINYGQFLFSWEGSFFDSFLTGRITSFDYIRSKFLFFAIAGFSGYLITLPYGLISYKILYYNTAMLVYNTGISSFLIIYFCTYNSTSIELGKSQFFNYQGTGVSQFLMIVPVLGIPVIIHTIFSLSGIPGLSIFALGVAGLPGIFFNRQITNMIAEQFLKRKYVMAAGFRKK